VAQFGFDTTDAKTLRASPIVVVEPDGRVGTAPDGVMVANGMVLTADGRTLICAESAGGKVSAYDVGANGALSNRRTFADLPAGHFADGICLDAAGGVWVACCMGPGFIRVVEGGTITHLVPMPEGRFGYACMLGGADRRTLYMCTSERYEAAHLKACRTSRIESIRVDIAGAGLP
jgi:sugar lactone lactonase YvrE